MSAERWSTTHRDDHYYWLTAFLAARGARTTVCRTIAAIIVALGALQLLLMLTPAGPQGRTLQILAVGVSVGCVVIGWCWLRPWWPTSTQSKLCGVLGAACIAVACLIQANPLLGLLGATAFAVLNGVTALLHSGRLLAVTGAVSAVTVGVIAVRLAQTDVALAVGGAVIVVLANVFVAVTARMVMRMFDTSMLAGEMEPLTGLLSRRAFEEQFALMIGARTRDDDRYLVVLVVDLDSFSVVTGLRGVVGGKRARVAVGQRLRETVRRDAIVAHVDDAEFRVAELFTTADPTPLADRVRGAIYAAPLRLTASIGVVCTPLRPLAHAPPPEVLDEMLDIATAAMKDVRRAGGNGIRQVVSPSLDVLGKQDGAA